MRITGWLVRWLGTFVARVVSAAALVQRAGGPIGSRTRRMAMVPRISYPPFMAKRAVKSLHRTGRVSRKKASAVAKRLREELDSGAIKVVTSGGVRRKATASGRKVISFHVASNSATKGKSQRPRKAARKAAR